MVSNKSIKHKFKYCCETMLKLTFLLWATIHTLKSLCTENICTVQWMITKWIPI